MFPVPAADCKKKAGSSQVADNKAAVVVPMPVVVRVAGNYTAVVAVVVAVASVLYSSQSTSRNYRNRGLHR